MSTTLIKAHETRPGWRIVDAEGKVLGRMAAQIAVVLMGKDKPCYTPNVDCGDHVVVVNARKIKVDFRSKWRTKQYQRYTYYPGGLNVTAFPMMMEKHPDQVIHLAVRRMLPKSRLGRKMIKKLHIFPDAAHHHQNHRPVPMEIKRK